MAIVTVSTTRPIKMNFTATYTTVPSEPKPPSLALLLLLAALMTAPR